MQGISRQAAWLRAFVAGFLMLTLPVLLAPMADEPGMAALAAAVLVVAALWHVTTRFATVGAKPALALGAAAPEPRALAGRVTNLPHHPRLPRAPGLA